MAALDPRVLNELLLEIHTNVLMKRSVDHTVLETLAVGM